MSLMFIEQRQDMFMVAQVILKYWRKYMKDMTQLLLRARDKMQFCNQQQFLNLIRSIEESDTNLKLDWDDGSGEEWARFIEEKKGIVLMLNTKIGVVFIRTSYVRSDVNKLLQNLYVEWTENYDIDEWFIDLNVIRQQVPEIHWHTSEDAVNVKAFCLNDFYFATV